MGLNKVDIAIRRGEETLERSLTFIDPEAQTMSLVEIEQAMEEGILQALQPKLKARRTFKKPTQPMARRG